MEGGEEAARARAPTPGEERAADRCSGVERLLFPSGLAARRGGVRRRVVCLPTGAGKTVIFSHLSRLARRQVLVLAHREELLGQAADKIARALGDPAAVAI